ncbi:glycosyltransferase family 9 protein [Aeoliella mucimassa]|uniref:Lipopolysaccharide core heptosyltransferase RfaQ n=1 Tax=Aeoliella mucimassa TaxID=2527972 RepID=A0A518AVS2_9BACT|nr:glycosyltransferase family 9 protein [Aeoliella mucimassa]QDU58823.1 Lipopolysaccharide core heptosyltransferase RfaQ [Aeoliella mucimassa]
MAQPPRILIVRLTAMGDVIHGLPVASALRRQFPDSFLAWAVEGRAAELVEGHPDLDHVIRLPRHWWRSARSLHETRKQLRESKFDITVDLQCLTKSSIIAWLTGAPKRLGVAGANGREFSKWFNNCLTDVQASHVVDHYLGILKPLGIESPKVEFKLPESSLLTEYAKKTLADLNLHTPFAVLNPGAGWPSKLWPAERYGQVARHLHQQGVRSLAVWCGQEERKLAEQIVDTSQGAAVLAPATTMPELAAITRRANLFLGSDTGPMHLAVAVGTPTISLHGTSQADWCGAYGRSNIRLQQYYQGGTARQRRAANNTAMQAITVERVCKACDQLLARSRAALAG